MYVPKDAIRESVRSTMVLGAAGTLLAAAQNTLARRNFGPWGMFTHFGTTIVVFGSPPKKIAFMRMIQGMRLIQYSFCGWQF